MLFCNTIILLTGINASAQIDTVEDFKVNKRIKVDLLYFGADQIHLETNNVYGYFQLGYCRFNYNSMNLLSFRSKKMFGFFYNPYNNIVGVRGGIGLYFLGISGRCYLNYYTDFHNQHLSYKPAIGIDLRYFSIHWGPNIVIKSGLDEHLNRHSIDFDFAYFF